jgi:mono/diheme cytochrome c family protein
MKLFAAILTAVMCVVLLVALPAAAEAPKSAPAAAPKTLDGKELFLSQGCNTCHAVSTAGVTAKMKGSKAPDLATLTTKREPQWLSDFLRQQQADSAGKTHPKAFTGSDEQLGALLSWLEEQRKK